MSGRLGPGVAVLVIGPTICDGIEAIGVGGVIAHYIRRGDDFDGEWRADGDGWLVHLGRPVRWDPAFTSAKGIFPASSLMPLDGDQAEPEAAPATVDQPQPVEA